MNSNRIESSRARDVASRGKFHAPQDAINAGRGVGVSDLQSMTGEQGTRATLAGDQTFPMEQ
jgi:hypothetical protein